ncbi:hypothetical protein ACFU44_06975 [Nocardia rhizosphaerihabitans]|uniref:hypothetical protein n=1 Tax=Nocardia rhizosphaerihabitans TaxID=1691570 RepID=UPI00366E4E18
MAEAAGHHQGVQGPGDAFQPGLAVQTQPGIAGDGATAPGGQLDPIRRIGAESTVRALAELLVVLPLIYLVTAALGRPASTWEVFGVLGVVFGLLAAQDAVPTTAVLSAVAVLAVGLALRTRRVDRAFLLQVAGFVVFAAIAVAAQQVDLGWARVLVAAGWIGHGLWDYEHRHAHRTVARSFAEFCGLVDVLVGVAVLVVP